MDNMDKTWKPPIPGPMRRNRKMAPHHAAVAPANIVYGSPPLHVIAVTMEKAEVPVILTSTSAINNNPEEIKVHGHVWRERTPVEFTASQGDLLASLDRSHAMVIRNGRGTAIAPLGVGAVGGQIALAALTLLIDVIVNVILSLFGNNLKIDYGLIAKITFEEAMRALSYEHYFQLTSETDSILDFMDAAHDHHEDSEFGRYLHQADDLSVELLNKLNILTFPWNFEWWREIAYMQIATVRIVALGNLYGLTNAPGYLKTMKSVKDEAIKKLPALLDHSQEVVTQGVKDDVIPNLDGCPDYEGTIKRQKAEMTNVFQTRFKPFWEEFYNKLYSTVPPQARRSELKLGHEEL
jgi:hypothetical protein